MLLIVNQIIIFINSIVKMKASMEMEIKKLAKQQIR